MNKNQVYSFEGDPAVIIEEKDNTATALVLMRTENICNAVLVNTPVNTLEPYKCPEADDTVIERIYCEDGICKYPLAENSFGCLAGRCTRCLLESCEAIDVEDTDEASN
ncbi:MAG: hypothetical protein J6A25_07485 [Lachnospiraceae bacterium]|nr:hypothetical protein [Lachnospiraceae bacterium]